MFGAYFDGKGTQFSHLDLTAAASRRSHAHGPCPLDRVRLPFDYLRFMDGDYTASIADTKFADRSPASKHSARVGDRMGPHSNDRDRRTSHLRGKIQERFWGR